MEIISSLIHDMENEAVQVIDKDKSFQENVHQALYKMLEFRLEHQLTIKLFQEERDIGTPIVQDMMAKLEQAILSFIQEKIVQAIKSGEIKQCDPEITALDRKSTRLNSSHVSISYAVFCLKKK